MPVRENALRGASDQGLWRVRVVAAKHDPLRPGDGVQRLQRRPRRGQRSVVVEGAQRLSNLPLVPVEHGVRERAGHRPADRRAGQPGGDAPRPGRRLAQREPPGEVGHCAAGVG